MRKRVKVGQMIVVYGVEYRVGENSAKAINVLLELLETNQNADVAMLIDLYRSDNGPMHTTRGDLVRFPKVAAALEKK